MHSSIFFMIFSFILYVALIIGFFALAYFILNKEIKNGLIEAYKEIQKLKWSYFHNYILVSIIRSTGFFFFIMQNKRTTNFMPDS